MGSQLGNESKSFSETINIFPKHQTLPSSDYKQKCRKNVAFKTPVSSKRLKTKHEVTNSQKNGKMAVENTTEEKGNTLRRSKRKKNCESSIQPGKQSAIQQPVPKDARHNFKIDEKEIEDESLLQNSTLHLISKNAMKSFDKELFVEEADVEHNLNMKCTEDKSTEKQLINFVKEINPSVMDKTDDNSVHQVANCKTARRYVECDSSQANFQEIFSEVIADNKNKKTEVDTEKKNIVKNCTDDMMDKIPLDNFKQEKYEKNNDTKLIINEEMTNDLSLDQLYVDIKKADDIINSLVKAANEENICSVSRYTMHTFEPTESKQILHSSKNYSMDKNFYAEQNKVLDFNSIENYNILDRNSTEIESSKNYQTMINEQQKNSMKTKISMKNELSERGDGTISCCENLEMTEGNIEVKYNPSDNDSNHLDVSSVMYAIQNEMLHKYNASDEFNNQPSKIETDVFSTENYSSHENNVFDISCNSKIQIQDFPIKINDSEDATDETKISTENLEMKQKKLKLLYMSALDYEKENMENAPEIMGKGSEMKEENFCLDAGDKSIDNDAFATQKDIEMVKQELYDFSKELDEQNINESRMLNETKELKEDTKEKFVEIKKEINNFEIVNMNPITYETTTTKDPIKYDLTGCKVNKLYSFQEHFTTLPFPDKSTQLLQTFSDGPIYNNEINIEERNLKTEETEIWYKKKCNHEADIIDVETDAECLTSEQNENSKQILNNRRVENSKKLSEDATLYQDVDESFDMDDDFDLTASQINMIEIDESKQYKDSNEVKSHIKVKSCNDTHFGQNSLTVEIIDQLNYIRESVDSIKEVLNTFFMKNEERK